MKFRPALLLGLCAVAIANAQSPNGPDISAWYRLKTADTPLYSWLRLDSPLSLTVDSKKILHLGIVMPKLAFDFSIDGKVIGTASQLDISGGPGIVITALPKDGTIYLQISSAPIIATPQAVTVTDEKPVLGGDGLWRVVGMPTAQGVACFKNGMFQTPVLDYTLSDNRITAPAWLQTDSIVCQYRYFDLAK